MRLGDREEYLFLIVEEVRRDASLLVMVSQGFQSRVSVFTPEAEFSLTGLRILVADP